MKSVTLIVALSLSKIYIAVKRFWTFLDLLLSRCVTSTVNVYLLEHHNSHKHFPQTSTISTVCCIKTINNVNLLQSVVCDPAI